MNESRRGQRAREWDTLGRWRWARGTVALLCALALPGVRLGLAEEAPKSFAGAPTPSPESPLARLLARARDEVRRGVVYDGRYRALTFKEGHDTGRFVYPNGDLDPARGVCTDVVVRAFRAAGLDLQSAVHEDIRKNGEAYAPFVVRPDANIDHRRVASLGVFFARHGATLPTSVEARASFRPGDVIVWSFGFCPACKLDHVGLVSDAIGSRGLPLVIHNLGPHPAEDDALDAWRIVGHYRHPLVATP